MTEQEIHERDKKYLVQCLTRDLILWLMQDYNLSMQDAMDKLYNSHTYSLIENEKTGMYYQGTVYVSTYLEDEMRAQH